MNDNITIDIGKRLRELRGDKKQKQAAKELDIDVQMLGRYERGENTPNIYQIRKIAEYYGVTSDYILGLADEAASSDTEMTTKKYTGLDLGAVRTLRGLSGEYGNLINQVLKAPSFRYLLEDLFAIGRFSSVGKNNVSVNGYIDDFKKKLDIREISADIKYSQDIEYLTYKVSKSAERLCDDIKRANSDINDIIGFIAKQSTEEEE